MRALTTTVWTLRPIDSPILDHGCPRCGQPRSFRSARAFRINAQKRRLDVWVLFNCLDCDHTLRLPVHERVRVASLPVDHLERYHRNDPDLADEVAAKLGATISVVADGEVPPLPFVATVRAPRGAQLRLDQLLAKMLGHSRAQVRRDWDAGRIGLIPPAGRRDHRAPVRDGQQIWVGEPERPMD